MTGKRFNVQQMIIERIKDEVDQRLRVRLSKSHAARFIAFPLCLGPWQSNKSTTGPRPRRCKECCISCSAITGPIAVAGGGNAHVAGLQRCGYLDVAESQATCSSSR